MIINIFDFLTLNIKLEIRNSDKIMSRVTSKNENINFCETEQNLNIILKNIKERHLVLEDLEL